MTKRSTLFLIQQGEKLMNNVIGINHKLKIYNGFVLPTIRYGVEIWYPSSKNKTSYLKLLNRMQSKILTATTCSYRTTNRTKFCKLINVPEISNELDMRLKIIEMKKAPNVSNIEIIYLKLNQKIISNLPSFNLNLSHIVTNEIRDLQKLSYQD